MRACVRVTALRDISKTVITRNRRRCGGKKGPSITVDARNGTGEDACKGMTEERAKIAFAKAMREALPIPEKLLLSLPRERPLLGRDLHDLFFHLMFRETKTRSVTGSGNKNENKR